MSSQTSSIPDPAPLTAEQRKLIKDTVPLLAQHGGEITRRFYGSMLAANPDLKNVFSHSKQMAGHQADALAGAVLAYAAHIDDLTPILPVVEKICHKHVSLHIVPEQYKIVGNFLLRAVADVVKEVAGADIFKGELYDAWYAGYWHLARICINREAELYKQAGWIGWKEFVVDKRHEESEEITSFYLKPKDGVALPPYHPGQYISVQLHVSELGHYQSRQYSLSDTPTPDYYRISVKRERGIRATKPGSDAVDTAQAAHPGWMSNLLHDKLKEDDTIEVAFPFGEFFLDEGSSPIVLISAGVGLTPLLAMLNTLLSPEASEAPKRKVSWVQAVRGPASHAFKDHIATLHKAHPEQLRTTVFYSQADGAVQGQDFDLTGRLDLAKVDKDALFLDDPSAEYYTCGPESFMIAIAKELKARGVARERVHAELFGSGSLPA